MTDLPTTGLSLTGLPVTDLTDRVSVLIQPVAESLGFELVRVTYGGGRRPTLQVMAERPDGSMSVEDCATLSREISVLLDVEDAVDGEYLLEVSSPGIDRPLTRPKDFTRWTGFDVKVELKEQRGDRRRYRGRLSRFDDGQLTVDTEDSGQVLIELDDVAKAKLLMTDDLLKAAQQSADKTET